MRPEMWALDIFMCRMKSRGLWALQRSLDSKVECCTENMPVVLIDMRRLSRCPISFRIDCQSSSLPPMKAELRKKGQIEFLTLTTII
jgi:hypothetical protein